MADRPHLQRLAKRLTDEGKLIEAGWIGLRLAALPDDAPAEQLEDLRDMSFAGAQHVFVSIMDFLDPDDIPTDADLDRMATLQRELDAFIREFDTRRLIPQGSA